MADEIMIAVVQAKCPSCQQVLRIPKDWLSQPMRCKRCGQMFQGRTKSGFVPAASTVAEPAAAFFVDEPAPAVSAATVAAPVDERIAAGPSPAVGPVTPVLPSPIATPQIAAALQPAAPVAMPVAPAAPTPYGYNPYGFAPYNNAFDFDGQPASPMPAGTAELPPGRPKKPPKKNHWWKPAALGGVALVIMVGVLIASGGSFSGIFSPRKKSAEGDTQQVSQSSPPLSKAEPPIVPPTKNAESPRNTPPAGQPKSNPKIENPPSKNEKVVIEAPPRITPKTASGPETTPKTSLPEYFPRRALLISVNNYLFANSLHYGSPQPSKGAYPGSSTGVLARQFTLPPFKMPASQVTELSDGDYPRLTAGLDPDIKQYNRPTHTTVKNVIETTLVEFLITSRPQDRVVVFFAGHAIDGDDEAYLVPLEGDLQDPKTLIPLSWVYEQLSRCKARQKLLILDVCRFPPARGFELPAGGPMGEVLDAKLQAPPPGVQVWSSCTKEQQSLEFEKGSLFVQAICASLQQRFPGIAQPDDPLPLEELVVRVNQYMKAQLESQKMTQTSRLTGTAPADGTPYDPAVPLPDALVLRPPLLPTGGQVAGTALVKGVLDEIDRIPPVRAINRSAQKTLLKPEYLPPFPSAALEPFKSDMAFDAAAQADPEKYPLRVAVLEAVKTLEDNAKFVMRENLVNPGGPIAPKVKEEFLRAQEDPGLAVFELERTLKKFEDAGKEREKESSKRWQAHYDYTLARLLSRTVYTYEYNYMLAQVRSDSLPPLEAGVHNGWRIGSREKPQIREEKVRTYVRTIRGIWERIKTEYPNTPWEMLARRESLIALGLEWRASRD